jgi:uncharacterized membrane protein
MLRKVAAWALVVVAVGWGTAIVAAPLAHGSADRHPTTRLAALTYVVGALVCHQKPERSFHVAAAQLPVCARCAALYWGGALGLAGWLLVRGPIDRTRFARAIFILALPIAVTLATSAVGLWDPSNALRAISSVPLGVALGAVVSAVVLGDMR